MSEELQTESKKENKKKRNLVEAPADFKLLEGVKKMKTLPPVPQFNAPPLPLKEALTRALELEDADYVQHCLRSGSSFASIELVNYFQKLREIKGTYENLKTIVKKEKSKKKPTIQKEEFCEVFQTIYKNLSALDEKISRTQKKYQKSDWSSLFEKISLQLEQVMLDLNQFCQQESLPVKWGSAKTKTLIRLVEPKIEKGDDLEEDDNMPVFGLRRSSGGALC